MDTSTILPCPYCGEVGNPECYMEWDLDYGHGMTMTPLQKEWREYHREGKWKR